MGLKRAAVPFVLIAYSGDLLGANGLAQQQFKIDSPWCSRSFPFWFWYREHIPILEVWILLAMDGTEKPLT